MQVITNGLEQSVQNMDEAERKTGFRPYIPSPQQFRNVFFGPENRNGIGAGHGGSPHLVVHDLRPRYAHGHMSSRISSTQTIALREYLEQCPVVSRQLFSTCRQKKVRKLLLISKRKRVIIPVGNLKVDSP
jgi:hypothetical protein